MLPLISMWARVVLKAIRFTKFERSLAQKVSDTPRHECQTPQQGPSFGHAKWGVDRQSFFSRRRTLRYGIIAAALRESLGCSAPMLPTTRHCIPLSLNIAS
jgi:hypothetical protein